MQDFEDFFRVEKHIKELREREETRDAVKRLLELITRACEYVRDKTKSGYFSKRIILQIEIMVLTRSGQGNMFGTEYKDTIDGLKTDFYREMKSFDRSVSLETFRTVGRIDETVHAIRECAQHFCIATVASSTRHHISRRTDYRPRISEGKVGRS